jgi:undecaprenyl phosphate-alpha-L-ara4N flippase subunit ArnE
MLLEYMLIAVSLMLTTSGQLLQKTAADLAEADTRHEQFLVRLLFFKQTYIAVACLLAGTATWLCVLFYMDVSKAVPFLSLGIFLVAFISKVKLKEHISAKRWLGIILIVCGLSVIAMS